MAFIKLVSLIMIIIYYYYADCYHTSYRAHTLKIIQCTVHIFSQNKYDFSVFCKLYKNLCWVSSMLLTKSLQVLKSWKTMC